MNAHSKVLRVVTHDAQAYVQAARRLLILRQAIETALHEMAAALDDLDAPGVDLEENGDDEPAEEDEPVLGSVATSASSSQEKWAAGGTNPNADECEPSEDDEAVNEDGDTLDDGEKDDADFEPSLGATLVIDQDHAWRAPMGWAGSGDDTPGGNLRPLELGRHS